jgi:hypothetical protein
VKLGPLATLIASRASNDGKISQDSLEGAISALMGQADSNGRDVAQAPLHPALLEQLQLINHNLIRIRHIQLASAANSDTEIQQALEILHSSLGKEQKSAAQTAGLDVPKLSKLMENMEHRRHQFEVQTTGRDAQHSPDRER